MPNSASQKNCQTDNINSSSMRDAPLPIMKAGLECHQQLDVDKLFCRCPIEEPERHVYKFTRKLRLTASELEKIDPAALEAFKRDYLYEYSAYDNCSCLIEADEEPIAELNKEALDTILLVSIMCNSKIFDELFVMRKIVLDGSNTSGFQRTMLISSGGEIQLPNKKVGVQTIVLEEDACTPLEKLPDKVGYSLHRLGVPLIELATEPVLTSPKEIKDCAMKIGEIFRRTCKSKRGLGSIRQDVNVSIEGGARVELKGVQDIELMEECVIQEVKRQENLLLIKDELKKRNISEKDLTADFIDVTKEFSQTNCNLIKKALERKAGVLALKLKGFSGLLGKEIQKGRRFGTELADYLEMKNKINGLFHSDELPNYGLTDQEKSKILSLLKCEKDDGFVLVCEEKQKAEQAMETIVERCKVALLKIPGETRNVNENASSSYLRPLPGAGRMYPETDHQSVPVDSAYIKELSKKIPLTVEEREKLYAKYGLNQKLIDKMKLDNYAIFFEKMLAKGYDPTFTAILLLEILTTVEREGVDVSKFSETKIETILSCQKKGRITKDVVDDVIKTWMYEPKHSIEEVLTELNIKKTDSSELEKVVKSVVEKNLAFIKEKGSYAESTLMGQIMKELKGKASGTEINAILRKEIAKILK